MRIVTLILKRTLAAVPVLLFLTLVVFLLTKASGLDPARAQLGGNARPEQLAAVRHDLWLDRSLPAQYLHYNEQLLQGDLGTSLRTHRQVTEDLRTALPATIELTMAALAVAIVLALVIGITSALATRGASAFRLLMIAGASTPVFLLALGGIYVFYGKLGWLPASGQSSYPDAPTGPTGFLLIDSLLAGEPAVFLDALKHLVMPTLALAIVPAVAVGRVLRSSMLENLDADYIRTARSKGLRESAIVVRHVIRNSLTAPLSMLGLQLGLIFAADVVVESIFAWPGIGEYAAESIPVGDFPVIAAVTLIVGVAYVFINAVVDVLQSVADPRIQL
jgi:peptide/nickel transport system permease protein